jgi:hypothetical protein
MIPLSSRIAVIISNEGNRIAYNQWNRELVRSFNILVAAYSHRFVMAGNEAQLRHIIGHGHIDDLPIRDPAEATQVS